jgi:hypothetical protein
MRARDELKVEDYQKILLDYQESMRNSSKVNGELCDKIAQLRVAMEKKAKEIALKAAVDVKPPSYATQNQLTGPAYYDVVKEADKIYQWLIKE